VTLEAWGWLRPGYDVKERRGTTQEPRSALISSADTLNKHARGATAEGREVKRVRKGPYLCLDVSRKILI